MKILYLASYKNNDTGVAKKISAQIKALSKQGETSYFIQEENKVFYVSNTRKKYAFSVSSFKIIRDILYWKKIYNFIIHEPEFNHDFPNVVYYRKTPANKYLNKLLSFFKENKSYIFKEIPTYPYKKELKNSGLKGKLKYLIDSLYLDSENKNIDNIVTFSNDNTIEGIQTVIIDNSIPHPMIKRTGIEKITKNNKKIDILSVTSIEYWQGLDRAIYGLHEYYKREDNYYEIKMTIVGEGTEKNKLESLVHELKLDKYVVFLGHVSGAKLSKLFKEADIGLGQLGLHRKGMNQVSSLKTKEYLSEYLPVVYSGQERIIDDFKYTLKLPNDDSPINFDNIIHFIFCDLKNMKNLIEFEEIVEHNFTWNSQMSKVFLRYIQETDKYE